MFREVPGETALPIAGGKTAGLVATLRGSTLSVRGLPVRGGLNAYLVKILQSDGHLAWASPLFVDHLASEG